MPLRCAQRICALVIGVDKYHHKQPLQNAVRDARAVGNELEPTGAIIVNAINCTKSELNVKIDGPSSIILNVKVQRVSHSLVFIH